MRNFYLAVVFCLLWSEASSQKADTAHANIPKSWNKFYPGIRIAAGAQKAFYSEFGLSFQKFTFEERHGYVAVAYYGSFEWRPAAPGIGAVYGFKAGAEMSNNGASGGIEIKYQYGSGKEDVVITPKYGLGIGSATLFYGYNISTNKRPFVNIGRHQLSLAINTNIIYYHLFGPGRVH